MTSRLDALKARVAEQRAADYPRPHVAWEDIERLVAVVEAGLKYVYFKNDSEGRLYARLSDVLAYWLAEEEQG